MKYVVLGLLVVVGLYGVHRLASWAERRGWIYYREHRGSSGSLSDAALEVHSLLEPSRRQVLEEKQREQSEDEESSEP
jgi:hypothetical protein